MKTAISPSQSCRQLPGVGPKTADRLAKLGIQSWQDLLYHLPLRYEDRSRITPIKSLEEDTPAVVVGEVVSCKKIVRKQTQLFCQLKDETGSLNLRFFHAGKGHQHKLVEGSKVLCFGSPRWFGNQLEMTHPEYRLIENEESIELPKTLTPVYPSTEGLYQNTWRQMINHVLERLEDIAIPTFTPENIRAQQGWPSLKESLLLLHRPPVEIDQAQLLAHEHPALHYLSFEELLAQQIKLLRRRNQRLSQKAPSLPSSQTLVAALLKDLPFSPTRAQTRVYEEIRSDLSEAHPSLRLVQGDVGSGKTLVAALASLQAIENKTQVALMAPTELLAEQHYQNFKQWFEPLNIEVSLLTGRLSAGDRRVILNDAVTEKTSMVIGTQALLQDDVSFKQLGLIIIDEQHRFGVNQQLALWRKGQSEGYYPHQLWMTATPIPRALALTAYADLQHSRIDEMPPGRTPVTTVALSEQRRAEVIARIQSSCAEGRQAYWVCNAIEESEQRQSACLTADSLKKQLPNLRIGLVHGKLSSAEKEKTMQAFQQAQIDLLVATTVIEVGVDVPAASLMIIENAERLGLAQLHQLRGRVGRGSTESFCVLLYQSPLTPIAKQRLSTLREENDGFVIAEQDLHLRGPGELLGTRQAGIFNLRIANLVRDQHLLPLAREVAEDFFGVTV